ncbi:hypothetical protein K1T71_009511 [Dendrolimus kikuchii]|uniref:Uncharacterized protein n=1 Tax=Dendrolimus kikuchii TaxID=765133 RepID=A0ACC1CS75_9NEOP|nr:hypothetical protein K1T71_009511 [Dendrolimus kikuchii]
MRALRKICGVTLADRVRNTELTRVSPQSVKPDRPLTTIMGSRQSINANLNVNFRLSNFIITGITQNSLLRPESCNMHLAASIMMRFALSATPFCCELYGIVWCFMPCSSRYKIRFRNLLYQESNPGPLRCSEVGRQRLSPLNHRAHRQTAHLMESGHHRPWTFATPKVLQIRCCSLKGNWNLVTNAGTQLKVVMATYFRLGLLQKQVETLEAIKQIERNMKRVENNNNVSCYLPHHGVLKPDSSTTQLRTVFNASSKTSSGYSLNDLMERGPNLQRDLQSLLLTWRQHKYVISADIEKMFRQILIRERDQDLQRIIWRTSAHEPLSEYKLTTITYGTKAAPYLAMRTLKQLALDNEEAQRYPMATKALKNSFYMDDLLEGGDSLEQTRTLQYELIQILKEAGMNIRKWSSNSLDLVKDLPTNSLAVPLHFKNIESRKTLGLSWKPDSDTFTFQNRFEQLQENTQLTKRQLLSYISKIYDPLGWLSPLTIRAKLLFQNTWLNNSTTWDGQLPDEIKEAWNQLNHDFQHLNTFEIPRYLGQKQTYTLHAFCDASEKVYACAIYVVTNNNKGECTSRLVTAKTKLAPVKTKLTLPRLELCGAVLLTRLLKKVMETLTCDKIETFAWTDSMIVLGWIHGGANRWKQFVSNRVQTIITVVPPSHWHHVSSAENAADCATRGLSANQLQGHSLWWEGPRWLKNFHEDQIGKITYPYPQIETKKLSVHAALCENKNFIIKLLNDMQSIRRVATTIGWLSRYIEWLRNKQNIPIQGYLTNMEINHSYNLIIKTVQFMEFQEDFTRLKGKQCVKRNSKLICLNPYLDEKDGLLKVGGRLSNSHLSQSAKHPIILPSHSRLTDLIIRQAHLTTLHGGPSLTLTHIREKYWILSGLRTVKRELNKCVTCRKHSDQSRPPIMADLPAPRVTPSRPFTHAGVDFTGHFDIKANKGRGVRTHKGYVAVFVCLSTKAVHLELVSDLSTPGFLAAFRRFCARRGTPSHVYSDNGTNFVGANRLLKKEYQEIAQSINRDFFNNIKEYNIQWTFNAPAYPSAGGLWEAAVKSFKYHLRRVIGEQKLTYEEFITLLHQIEACLNSRPLITVNENSSDICLTPGHFLIGDTLLSRPQTDSGNINLTTRWRMIQAMNKDIWKAWSSDYLKQLQARTKWRTPTKNIEVEDIVLVKEENLPPGKWALGRVVDVHPGKDGHVRVVSLKTKHGVIKRPALKLSVLPVKKDEDETSLEQGDETSRPRRDERERQTEKHAHAARLATIAKSVNPISAPPTGSNGIKSILSPSPGYFCVFVCLATKAVHLEAVSELSTDAFFAALQSIYTIDRKRETNDRE